MFVHVSVFSALTVLCAFLALLPRSADKPPLKQPGQRPDIGKYVDQHHAGKLGGAWAARGAGRIAELRVVDTSATFE